MLAAGFLQAAYAQGLGLGFWVWESLSLCAYIAKGQAAGMLPCSEGITVIQNPGFRVKDKSSLRCQSFLFQTCESPVQEVVSVLFQNPHASAWFRNYA